jgi:hypothetical protein
MREDKKARKRGCLFVWLILVIITGIASRKFSFMFPAFLGKYPGDSLWAVMVFLMWGIIKPGASTCILTVLALVTSYLDEFSQLYQAPWINAVRHTFIGHAILGSWFSWMDMVAYTVGVGAAAVIDWWFNDRMAGG